MYDSIRIFESQPDWLTVVAHGEASRTALLRKAELLASYEAAEGNRIKPFHSEGYVGYQVARVRLGTSDRGTLVQLSGDMAASAYDDLYPIADAVNRLDLAVTVQVEPNDEDVVYQHALEYGGWQPHGRKKATYEHRRYPNGGSSLIVGARTSDFYLRIYDKQRESHDVRYAGAWRYELECKACAAQRLALDCHRSADRPAFCQGVVHDYLTDHGIRPIFASDQERVLSPGFRRRTDDRSRLAWLSRSVAPSVDWLRQIGRGGEALERLGLEEAGEGTWRWRVQPPERP